MKTVIGRLCDESFSQRRCFIAYGVNSVACDPYGIIRDLNRTYPYEEAYTRRKRLYSLSRATIDSRDEPGTILVHNPPDGVNSPHLIACVSQYGWGQSIDENVKSMKALESSKDQHYVQGLRADTKVNRHQHFQTCLKKLAILVMGHRDAEQVVFPAGIGRLGRCDEEWMEVYLPMIKSFAARVEPIGVETILVQPPICQPPMYQPPMCQPPI